MTWADQKTDRAASRWARPIRKRLPYRGQPQKASNSLFHIGADHDHCGVAGGVGKVDWLKSPGDRDWRIWREEDEGKWLHWWSRFQ